ncbi:AbrB/MazE/SpoVT family DNA-binding domain-containing protein [Spirosoma montaniterrae]|uniref:MazF family transcriptional regulator n=1 Tax=Spirosoma montaniterrae TaxID=1178516 RepID=A0A1P9X0F4_9BACT|nr:AbrB/MazE/SpoVT family DNA-binding domain-containing protein [Spirosoma montaniterrae]AQG81109.1 MazF family transcriptional regulator [Spirosoma montaniterrae]
MRLSVVSIGNSKGIRIPKAVLDKYRIKDSVEVEMRDDALVLKPVRTPREGWEEQFRQAITAGDLPDEELLEPFPNDFDTDDWTW